MAKKDRPFVKSADTSTSARDSKSQLDTMLRRYGASAIATSEDIAKGEISVSFVVPDHLGKDATKVPVRLPVRVGDIYRALWGHAYRPNFDHASSWQQAERVAWRNVVLWVDAALSASAARLQTITEAFFAHTVVGPEGQRMVEVVEQYQSQLGPGVQRLLTAPADVEVAR